MVLCYGSLIQGETEWPGGVIPNAIGYHPKFVEVSLSGVYTESLSGLISTQSCNEKRKHGCKGDVGNRKGHCRSCRKSLSWSLFSWRRGWILSYNILSHVHSLPPPPPMKNNCILYTRSRGQEPDPGPQGCQVGFLTLEHHSIPNNQDNPINIADHTH